VYTAGSTGGGQYAIQCDTSYSSNIETTAKYDLTSSAIYAKVAPYQAGSAATSFNLAASTGNFLLYGYSGGNLAVYKDVAGVQTQLFATTYNAVLHAWWRIREASGTTYFDTSYDGLTWVNQFSYADTSWGFALTSLTVEIQAGDWGSDPTGTSYVYNVNAIPATSRSQYMWPFAWNACWNMPISASATYATAWPAGTAPSTFDYSTEAIAVENNSVLPSFPVKTFSDGGTNHSVYCDPNMTGNGAWNDTCTFLDVNGDQLWSGQTLELTAGGSPSLGGESTFNVNEGSIKTGTGQPGAHGGSDLSTLGGTLTQADLTGSGPITHAMKVLFNGLMLYSSAGAGYQWPATTADYEYNDPANPNGNYYGGSNPLVVEGALLALPPSINPLTRYTDPLIRRIATAMQCYGCYICDNTASGSGNYTSVVEMNYDAASSFNGGSTFNSDLLKMYGDLMVVTNSSSSTPGGGTIGTNRYAPYAPPFTDGTGVAPTVTVVSP
jgi:hypothetical protein